MFGFAAVIAFAVALLLDLANLSNGHWSPGTFTTVGLLCLAVHLVARPTWFQRNPPQ